nr:hypothetical protein [Candidatus Freyarchaeota archaeon]
MKRYWGWQNVGVHWSIVQRLLVADIVRAYGGRRKEYLLVDRDAVKKALKKPQGEVTAR